MRLQRIVNSWSIRRKLLVLILTVLLPGAGIIVHDSIKDRRQELEDTKRQAILMVESLSALQGQVAADKTDAEYPGAVATGSKLGCRSLQ